MASPSWSKDVSPSTKAAAENIGRMDLNQAKAFLQSLQADVDSAHRRVKKHRFDFIRAFQPERGDLLYGLRDTRTEYLKAWEARMKDDDINRLVDFLTLTKEGQKPNWNIIDNFNDYFFLGGAVDFDPKSGSAQKALGQLYSRLQNVVGGATRIDMAKDRDRSIDQLEQRTGYAEALIHSRYSPTKVFDASAEKVAKEGFRATGFIKTSVKKGAATSQNRSYLAIRRACKFGLGLAASHGAFAGSRVHFLLDGLDLEEVALKKTRQGYGGRVSVSITTSEVRYCYRNWAKLKNVVTFYVNLKPVKAPWEEDWSLETIGDTKPDPIKAHKDLWDAYGQARVGKPEKELI